MDNPSDEAIAEALRLTMCNFSQRGIDDFKDADHFEYGHAREVLKLIDQRNKLVEAVEAARLQFEFYAKEHDAKAEAARVAHDDACYWGNVAEQNATKAEWQKRAQQAQTNHDFAAKMSGALRLAQQEGQSNGL